jgi:hypothetical protein
MHEIIMDSKNIDHKDGNTYDNRKENLRVCTEQENAMNKRTPKNNTSGVKGVHYAKKEEKWKAYITFKGKRIHLGTYTNIEDAINKRLKAEGKYFGEFNRGKI